MSLSHILSLHTSFAFTTLVVMFVTSLTFPSIARAWDLTTAVYDDKLFNVGPQVNDPGMGMAFNSDGTKMFVVGSNSQTGTSDVYQYSLGTPFDASTAVFVGKYLRISGEVSIPTGLTFNTDGTKMFIANESNVYEYALSTGFDVSTGSLTDSFGFGGLLFGVQGLAMSDDGMKMFVVNDGDTDAVYEYALSTSFDASTASFTASTSIAAQDTFPRELAFNADGTKMFLLGSASDAVYEYTLSSAFDVTTISFVDSFSAAAQENQVDALAFSTDGTKMYIAGNGGDDVNEYTLGTSFDVSTASAVDTFSLLGQDTTPQGLTFNTAGTKMFVVGGTGDDVNEYTLSTGFDVSTAAFVDSFSVASQETGPTGLTFNTDGTKMFVVGSTGDKVYEYALSTGFDVSTGSFTASTSVAAQETTPTGVAFNTDGTKMFVVGSTGDDVNEYTLSTGFDISTASFVDSFSVAAQDTTPQDIAFSDDGTRMYIAGDANDNIYEYSLAAAFDVSTASFETNVDVSVLDLDGFGSGEFNTSGVAFRPNGTKMYVIGTYLDSVIQFSLTPPDTTAPSVAELTPLDNAVDVSTSLGELIIEFDEEVTDGNDGAMVLRKVSDDTIIASATPAVNDEFVTLELDDVIPLEAGTSYYVTLDAGVVEDLAGNAYAGISGIASWNFTTIEEESSGGGGASRRRTDPPTGPTNSGNDANIARLQALIEELKAKLAVLLGGTPAVTNNPFTRDLEEGSTGTDVTALQDYLIKANKGPAAQALAANGTTQLFGPLTKAALIEFQAAVGISPAAGYFGPRTRGYVQGNP